MARVAENGSTVIGGTEIRTCEAIHEIHLRPPQLNFTHDTLRTHLLRISFGGIATGFGFIVFLVGFAVYFVQIRCMYRMGMRSRAAKGLDHRINEGRDVGDNPQRVTFGWLILGLLVGFVVGHAIAVFVVIPPGYADRYAISLALCILGSGFVFLVGSAIAEPWLKQYSIGTVWVVFLVGAAIYFLFSLPVMNAARE